MRCGENVRRDGMWRDGRGRMMICERISTRVHPATGRMDVPERKKNCIQIANTTRERAVYEETELENAGLLQRVLENRLFHGDEHESYIGRIRRLRYTARASQQGRCHEA